MRKVIAAINTTIDGFCDHTAGIADQELHDHYTGLLNNSGVVLYGRVTFELMSYWKPFLDKPSGDSSLDDFAKAIDRIPKVIFSHTLSNPHWDTATLAQKPIQEIVEDLKNQSGKDILVGSRSMINQLMKLKLIDEYQLCIHPVVIGKGLPLFDENIDRTVFQLTKTKTFKSGAIILHYQKCE
ncbi:dihydrofolate reductase family protein [Marinoscillum pacificum]|uniref:dihydrofolate reductase family protein n=1 Tax=Marinoscillum pacificum TaxID=392723 RepID=UPI0021589425|nr:dihydrofolate reductase family protein [Marinoscillum pacificum]